MKVGQKVVFVRDVKGVGVGKQGTVMRVANDAVLVGCKLQGQLAPVLAQMWDVLPERVWKRISRTSPNMISTSRSDELLPG